MLRWCDGDVVINRIYSFNLKYKKVDKRNYAFGKINFILMAVGMLVVILGFILMSGGGSDETVFDNDIFSVRRIKVAPVVCFLGFISIIYAIIKKPKDE